MVKNSPLDRDCQRIPLIDMRAVHRALGTLDDHIDENDWIGSGLMNYYAALAYQDDPHYDCKPERGLCYAKKENCHA